jgi:hypothetical protein
MVIITKMFGSIIKKKEMENLFRAMVVIIMKAILRNQNLMVKEVRNFG